MQKKLKRGGFLPNFITQQCSTKICFDDVTGENSINDIFNSLEFGYLMDNASDNEGINKKNFVTFLLKKCKEKGLYSLNGKCKEGQTIYTVSELYDKIKKKEHAFIEEEHTKGNFNKFFGRLPVGGHRKRSRKARKSRKQSRRTKRV